MCGGCHQHGLPVLRKTFEKYKGNPDVKFIAIQTAFERYDKNDLEGAKKTGDDFKLAMPIGHQGKPGKPAPLLWSYDAPGTPWTIIIDREGIVRFNKNFTTEKETTEKIDSLLKN